MGSGLEVVLAAHLYRESTVGRAAHCSCGMWILGGLEITHRAHVAAMIVAHLEAVAGDARGVIAQAVIAADLERGGETGDHTVDAAITTFINAVTG